MTFLMKNSSFYGCLRMGKEKEQVDLGARLVMSEIAAAGVLGQLFWWLLRTNMQVARYRNRNGPVPEVRMTPSRICL